MEGASKVTRGIKALDTKTVLELTQTSLELVTPASLSHVLRLQVHATTPGVLLAGLLAA